MFKSLERKSLGERAVYILVSAIFMAVALSYCYILVWTVIQACKTHTEIVMNPFSLPEKWNVANFLEVFERLEINGKNFWDMLLNSVWFSIMGALLTQLCSVTFAYCITKYTFPGSKWIFTIFLVVLTLPLYGNGGAQYKLFYNLGLVDSYAQVITSYGALNIYTMYYMAYYRNVSGTYAEAARID